MNPLFGYQPMLFHCPDHSIISAWGGLMKKWILALVFLTAFARHAGAVDASLPIISIMHCSPVTISSSVPTEVTGNLGAYTSTFFHSVWAVKVTNLSTSANLFCSDNSAVSSSIASAALGEEVPYNNAPPWNWLAWLIGREKGWYCINDTNSASSLAEVCLAQ
jgi:hypothetical protein